MKAVVPLFARIHTCFGGTHKIIPVNKRSFRKFHNLFDKCHTPMYVSYGGQVEALSKRSPRRWSTTNATKDDSTCRGQSVCKVKKFQLEFAFKGVTRCESWGRSSQTLQQVGYGL